MSACEGGYGLGYSPGVWGPGVGTVREGGTVLGYGLGVQSMEYGPGEYNPGRVGMVPRWGMGTRPWTK